MNDAIFFSEIRSSIFRGSMSQSQVDGLNSILAGWKVHGDRDDRKLAYVLATSYHETAHTMRAIAEYGKGRGRKYGRPDLQTGKTYYGRGHVQLTWKDNYRRMGEVVGTDLVNNPERALDPAISVKILIVGMMRGMFTGKKLSDYVEGGTCDFKNARRIVNGMDRASLIAGYSNAFFEALEAARHASPAADHVPEPDNPPVTGKPLAQSSTAWTAVAGAAATVVSAVGGLADKSQLLAGIVILAALGAAFWIIRERWKKSHRHGV